MLEINLTNRDTLFINIINYFLDGQSGLKEQISIVYLQLLYGQLILLKKIIKNLNLIKTAPVA